MARGAVRAAAQLLTVATDSSGCRRPFPITRRDRRHASCRGPRADHPFECGPDELIPPLPAMQGGTVRVLPRPSMSQRYKLND